MLVRAVKNVEKCVKIYGGISSSIYVGSVIQNTLT